MFIYIYIIKERGLEHKTRLTLSLFMEVSATSQEIVRSCICVLRAVMYLCVKGIKFASFYEFDKILELLRQCGNFVFFSFSFYSY
jgi:hypothetical protein